MEALGVLVGGVAHELNNPLASIVAFSQLIRTDPDLPPGLRQQADFLVQEANRTRSIVQALLDFARQRPPERTPSSVRALIDAVLGLQSYTLGRAGLEVAVEIPDDLPDVHLDRTQIQQVLVNLTLNAAQAIRSAGGAGTIRIAAETGRRADGTSIVTISVADDGPGVSRTIEDRLFVPFVTTKAPGQGTGLGLSVSFGIVAAHGGSLRHERGPNGRGAVFRFDLPVEDRRKDDAFPAAANGPAEQRAEPPAGRPSERSSDRRIEPSNDRLSDRPIRVLVLDDEVAIREFLGRVLRRGGYEPVLAATGDAALAAIDEARPDAILCDHRMAGMTGTEFHEAVAARDPELARRFAFMSGDVLNPDLREFADREGVVLLAKPFDIANVAKTVETLLARRSSERGAG